MRDSLILLLPVSSDAPLHWGVWSDDSMAESGKLDLVAAGRLSDKGLPVTLVAVSYTHLTLPTTSRV